MYRELIGSRNSIDIRGVRLAFKGNTAYGKSSRQAVWSVHMSVVLRISQYGLMVAAFLVLSSQFVHAQAPSSGQIGPLDELKKCTSHCTNKANKCRTKATGERQRMCSRIQGKCLVACRQKMRAQCFDGCETSLKKCKSLAGADMARLKQCAQTGSTCLQGCSRAK